MDIAVYKTAEAPAQFVPGSILLTHGNHSVVSSAIRFGQQLELPGAANSTYTWFNHAACVMKEDGTILEMLAKGASINNASKYQSRDYVIINPQVSTGEVADMLRTWQWIADNHVEYSWLTIGSIAVKLLTKSTLQLGDADALICSGAAVVGLCATSLDVPGQWRVAPGFVMPAEIALQFKVQKPTP